MCIYSVIIKFYVQKIASSTESEGLKLVKETKLLVHFQVVPLAILFSVANSKKRYFLLI